METKMYLELKQPITRAGGEPLNKLRVNVDYQKGGVNYFSGDYNESGVYIYIQPCTYNNGIIGTVITGKQHLDGYKILLKELNRKSQKQIDLMAEKVLPYAQQIADLYSDGRHQDIYNLVKSIVNSNAENATNLKDTEGFLAIKARKIKIV